MKICTGASLSEHVVRIVFLIFDQDGDGRLSDREFIAIMRDRIHRGLQVNAITLNYITVNVKPQTCSFITVTYAQRRMGRFQTLCQAGNKIP